jgi:regulator of protease activity HflC (stomatin/prohibitin superfamily)
VNTILNIVPQQQAFVVERFGRFSRVLQPGLHILIPFVERIAYIHSQKETPIHVAGQTAITKDNVSLTIDGVLFVRIVDPVKASYGVENPMFAVTMLAQTSMRSELGRIELDTAFSQRDELNQRVVASLAPAAREWGLEVLRYEIKDIVPPSQVRAAMELVAEADRKKRAAILQSEGDQQKRINSASGEAEAIFRKAEATARSVRILADSIKKDRGSEAVSLRIAEQYVEAFGNLAKEGTTVLLPPNGGFADAGGMVAQALSIYKHLGTGGGSSGGSGGGGGGGGSGGGGGRGGNDGAVVGDGPVSAESSTTSASNDGRFTLQKSM